MALLSIRVQPRASRNEIGEMSDNGALKIRVTAAPIGGEANAAVLKLLAKRLKIAPSTMKIVRGATSRNKTVEIAALSESELRQRL